ncbi:nucleotidyltransferase family protein [Actinopolymorpha singaporensis]|uniref:nucleotidyltransferase family protein n=1 Tax=Actinopolymorpha singaporensis TaxID=117157 RepID=UPI0012FD712D|nr:nucleotidyltransferase domain-containing protein [Actinopolymorpha singaporensis]
MNDDASISRRMAEVARRLVAKLPDDDVRAAVLFGSVAWGDANEASDIDLMLCLDRPVGYRLVTRVRVADILGRTTPELPTSPVFADIDRISAEYFENAVDEGIWHARVARSLIFADTDGWFAGLRARVSATFRHPDMCARRARPWYDASLAHSEAARRLLTDADDDLTLATLLARLALENVAVALIETSALRASPTHFLASARSALETTGSGHLYEPLQRGLGLDVDLETAAYGVQAFHVLAGALREWLADPELVRRLGPEDAAWAVFTYADETYEEIAHKVAAMRGAGRAADLASYLDWLLKVSIRLNVGKALNLRLNGLSETPEVAEFHQALRAEPALFEQWCRGLRLPADRAEITAALAVGAQLRGRLTFPPPSLT